MDKFNIAQGPAHNDPTWVVIDGQRTGSGHLADGAKTLIGGLTRDDALGFALLLNIAYLDGKLDGQLGLGADVYFGHGPSIKGKIE